MMTITPSNKRSLRAVQSLAAATAATFFCLLTMGCGAAISPAGSATPSPVSLDGMHGNVHGGQQPVVGAQIMVYAAGTSGYASTDQNLLTASVMSDVNGNFNISTLYPCTAGQQLFIVALTGNPGNIGNNPNLSLMAALGDCEAVKATPNIQVNEVTTVAAVTALSPFMSAYNAVGATSGNNPGLVRAFTSAAKLANIATGTAPGPMLAAGATAPVREINSLANSVASCINSTGGTAGDQSPCGNLFNDTKNSSGTAPTDVVGALLNLAQNPAVHAADIYAMTNGFAPFQPVLTQAPADWSMSINYTVGGFNVPSTATVDASGNVWIANHGTTAGSGTVTELAQTGTPAAGSPYTGNGLNQPSAIAFDVSGNAWVTNQTGNSVSVFTSTGGVFTGSPFTVGGFSAPVGIAMDAANDVWITNSGNNSLTELYTSGTFEQQITGIATPSAVAINPK
jgi:hypothetical protein